MTLLRYGILLSCILLLSACFGGRNAAVSESKVDEVISLQYGKTPDHMSQSPEIFGEKWQALNPTEMELWIEARYEEEMMLFRELESNPYVEKTILNESGIPIDEVPNPDRNPDVVAELMDKEGTHTEMIKLRSEELAARKAEIAEFSNTLKALHALGLEHFDTSLNRLDNEQWDFVEAEYAKARAD